ncbi:efflux RND transporter periplasmic adaptor subunit [Granulicella sibirica]|uniref:Membrane fusion protein of RND family multidrug efflux pump n=1 Tax=Granulicella sibirica TaxID=2479048 RepID=A0A4Q0T529_9BACT|nr:efflux RND transporter periplasmic adaptor subunit [Granulicella sibirica]RXH57158.1 Membrane fusion protein of RND family multidrug efflux pump [Granulicella sibirica]
MAAAPVDAATVITRDIRVSDEFNGRVWPTNSVDIRPRVTGYIDRIAFREGQMVHKGDLLYVIDPRPYQDAADNAKAGLDREHAAADFAKIQEERTQRLKQSDAVSQEELQNRGSDLLQSGARVKGAEAALASAELNLSYTQVRSPIDGRISRTMLTLGNLAQADQTVLTTIVSVNPVWVYFDCDEQSYLRFQQSSHHGSGVGSENPVRVSLANEQNFPHAGHIDFVDNQLNPATGTIRLRVVLPNPDQTLTPGLFARVQLQSAAPAQAILIDDKAVLTDQDRKYVYVVGPGNVAQRKDIALGGLSDGLRIVKAGLTPQDRVVVGGLQLIYFPGAPITPKEASMQASTGDLNTIASSGKK